ncbi:excinuclease ABC subunit [Legionella beliardensis]|uniref:Excinuclease cho n=1 Tax=Legionella beliardensis TaxID=91822 RepID=A0A378I5M2_9GAMM|nr:3'-5' exonuclease family protein [Legionella beliardensis]STX27774.1 excinuclease ABC subunit [Legionella beliardensis]
MQPSFRWALVDIETTGLHIIRDKITEIAVIILTEKGIEATWHSLIKPERTIPEPISQLTGISNGLVNNAPKFNIIAEELILLLQGCVLVAHNARFDFGFLKNAFKRIGINFHPPILCTIKLFRALYPGLKHYNLASLAQAFGLQSGTLHRAQSDVNLLQKLVSQIFNNFSMLDVLDQAKKIYQQPSVPATLITNLNTFPESPGVYIFYGDERLLPLYIGKSISLRQRILSHFQSDHTHAKEFALSQQVKHIEIIPTAGELSALLLESALIKEKMPLYNRRLRKKKNIVAIKVTQTQGYLHLTATQATVDEECELAVSELFGAFRSMSAAKKKLLQWVKEFGLCPKLCGLEQANQACFSYQLKRCQGACIQSEVHEAYNQRVSAALQQFKREDWPFNGAIAIKEENKINKMTQYSVFQHWRHIGTVNNKHELPLLMHKATQTPENYDTYKILTTFLKKEKGLNIVELDKQLLNSSG